MMAKAVPLVVRRNIRSSPERLFDAFSSAPALAQWFTPSPDIGIQVLHFDFVIGGQFRFRYAMDDSRHAIVGGAYEVISRPGKIVMTWVWEPPDILADIPMQVTFDFLKMGEETEITITHKGIPSNQECTIHKNGWQGSLIRLEQFLKNSRSVEYVE